MSLKTVLATIKASLETSVQTSGDQSISGVKTFTGTLQAGGYQVAGVSTTSSGSETVYPIGTMLLLNFASAMSLNQAVTPYTGGGTTGSVISGTWRSRGWTYDSVFSRYMTLIQRVA